MIARFISISLLNLRTQPEAASQAADRFVRPPTVHALARALRWCAPRGYFQAQIGMACPTYLQRLECRSYKPPRMFRSLPGNRSVQPECRESHAPRRGQLRLGSWRGGLDQDRRPAEWQFRPRPRQE